ncbi:MAG: DNA polymerase III subunit delta [Deltaproteobacteria bacterium]
MVSTNSQEKSQTKKPLKPAYYLYGTDGYLVEDALRWLVKEAVGQGGFSSLNYHAYDGKSSDADEMVSAASTFPAFSDKRLVLIKSAEHIKEASAERFCEYLKDPLQSTCLVFVSGAAKIDAKSPLVSAISACGTVKAFNTLDESGLVQWIRKEARRQGAEISDDAAKRLAAIAGPRLRDVKSELDKIILFALDAGTIEGKDVEDAGIDCKEESVFALSDAIGAKDLKKALKVYCKVSEEAPLNLLGSIARHIRMLLKIKSAVARGEPASSAAQSAGVHKFYAGKYLSMSRNFTSSELVRAVYALRRADIDLKTSRMPKGMIMERLLFSLCGR